ncbi:MAG: cation:dicarboxylase symporter family transporter, partial [Acidobacteriota bacterium]
MNRIVGIIAAAVLCVIALMLGTPAGSAGIKIVQTILLTGAVVILGMTTLRKTGVATKIFAGLILGAVAGLIYGPDAELIRPVGTAFIRLIKMIVIPLIFASLLVGVASLGDMRKIGRIGGKTFAFYIAYYITAVALGLVLANTLKPGENIPESVQAELKANYAETADAQALRAEERQGLDDVLINIIPDNPAESLVKSDMLQ